MLLPNWVFNATSENQIINNAEKYLSSNYPDRTLIEIEGNFAICEKKN